MVVALHGLEAWSLRVSRTCFISQMVVRLLLDSESRTDHPFKTSYKSGSLRTRMVGATGINIHGGGFSQE